MANYIGEESFGRGRGRGRPICQTNPCGISLERNDLRKPLAQPTKNITDQSQSAFLHDKNLSYNGEIAEMSGSHLLSSPASGNVRSTIESGATHKLPDPCETKVTETVRRRKKYILSASAKEFVPRSHQKQVPSMPPLSPLTMAQPPPYTHCDIPQPMEKWSTIDDTNNSPPLSTDEMSLLEMENVLMQLTTNPASFDILINPLASMLNEWITTETTLRAIAEMIIDLAISEPNFRYTGARMCSFLCKSLDVQIPNTNFRTIILDRCHQEHRQFKEKASDPSLERITHRQGFAIFLGELFLHMEVIVNEVPQKMGVFLTGLHEIIKILLESPNDSNLKCIIQLLKFTGSALSDCEALNNQGMTPVMDHIFMSLAQCKQIEGISWNIQTMLNNIIELRSSNWGRNNLHSPHSEPLSSPQVMQPFHYRFNDPILYGPDGQPLSAEETQFLEANDYSLDDQSILTEEEGYLENPELYYQLYDEPSSQYEEMDDEILSAFEQFVLENENKARHQ